ncbi:MULTISPECIES: hypothetical protein [unclassified Schlesneria]|uniref:hypothetical protein n=1 Tax=Schlesneria TaxID=656899 RepID=UPI002F1BC590
MFPRLQRLISASIVAGICVANLGCFSSTGVSEGIYPVEGSVFVNGEPAEFANVLFVPKDSDAQPASAVVGPDGAFRLTTQRQFDGAEPGEYTVTISWAKPLNPNLREPDYGPELLPKKYQDPKKSDLVVEVEPTKNVLEPFEITATPPRMVSGR